MSDGCEGNIECILTYNGNMTNIIINYTLITLSLIPLYFVPPMLLTSALAFVGVAGNPPPSVQMRCCGRATCPWPGGGPRSWPCWWYAVEVAVCVFFFVFQIVLCLVVGCSGVSIVWAALLGFWCSAGVLVLRCGAARLSASPLGKTTRGDGGKGKLLIGATVWGPCLLAAVGDAFAIIYYAVTEPVITTAAHLCAIAMGVVIALSVRYCCGRAIVPFQGSSLLTNNYTDASKQSIENRNILS